MELTVEHIWRARNAVDHQQAVGFLSCIGEVRHFLRIEASSCGPEMTTELLRRVYRSAGSLHKGQGHGVSSATPRRVGTTTRGSHWSPHSDGGCYSDQRRLLSSSEDSVLQLDDNWGDVDALCPGPPSVHHRVMENPCNRQFSRQAANFPVMPPAPSSLQRPLLHPCGWLPSCRLFAVDGPPREMDASSKGNGNAYALKSPPISGWHGPQVWRPW